MSKTLAAARIRLNAVDLINQAGDPSSGGGVAAAIGSFLLQNGATAGAMWQKTSAPDTGWQRLVQSLAWLSVKDFGAKGDGVTDDTAKIQAAIDQASAQGGGVVWFPGSNTYAYTQLTLPAYANVQLRGAGPSSKLKWLWDAGSAAGSSILISDGAARITISDLQFDGSGLTNPAAGRTNHLVQIGTGGATGTIFEIAIRRCLFTGMVASSGDAIHVVGTTGNLVSRCWIQDSTIAGSRYGVCVDSGYEYVWVTNNYLSGGETELAFVASADVNGNAVQCYGNNIVHTSGSVRHGLRIEGGATGLITNSVFAENVILNGFSTVKNLQYSVFQKNVETSGAYASTDPVCYVSGATQFCSIQGNLIDRASGASAGPCIAAEKATGQPKDCGIRSNILVNEKAAGGFVRLVDATQMSVGGNICRASDFGSSTIYGIDVQAVTVAVTDILVGPGNVMTGAAGSMAAAVRFLVNGASVTDVSCVGNTADECDYGIQFEDAGAGSFNGIVMYAGNNFDSSTGDINNVGTTVRPRIGFNAGTQGANLITGSGSPEGVVTARIGSMYLRTDGGQGTSVYYKESGTGNTGWVALGGAPLIWGADSLGTVATARYLAPGYIAAASATEIQFAITRPGTIRNLRVQVATAGTDAGAVAFTVRKNGVDTTLTCALDNTASGAASDTTHSFTVVAGDLLSISVVKAGVVTLGQAGVTASAEVV